LSGGADSNYLFLAGGQVCKHYTSSAYLVPALDRTPITYYLVAVVSATGAVVLSVDTTAESTLVESAACSVDVPTPQLAIITPIRIVNAPILALDTKVVKRLALYNAFDVKKSRFCSD
jgi:hypothetical protein